MKTSLPILHQILVRYLRMGYHPGKEKLFKFLARNLAGKNIMAETNFGARMRLDARDYVQYEILRNGIYEPKTIKLIMRLLDSGGTYLDVGGNVGLHTLAAAARVGKSGRVITLEPNPRAFLLLLDNMELNGFTNVELILTAASNRSGLLRLVGSTASSLGTGREALSPEEGGFLTGVFELAQVLEGIGCGAVDVMKVDVEGQEIRVLEGLFQPGGCLPQNIIFEFFPEESKYGITQDNLLSLLREKQYEFLTVRGERYELGAPLPESNVWARLRGGVEEATSVA